MRRMTRLARAFLSILFRIALFVAVIGFVAFGTNTGRDFVREQVEFAIDGVLGPGYETTLGTQSIGMDRAGNVRLSWSDVDVARIVGEAALGVRTPVSRIAVVRVGVGLLPLFSGRVSIRSIEIAGAKINLSGARSVSPVPEAEPTALVAQPRATGEPSLPVTRDHLKRMADSVLASIETRFADVARIGVETVAFRDIHIIAPIAPDGGPFVARIERANFRLDKTGRTIVSARIGADKLVVGMAGSADFEPSERRIKALHLEVGPIALGAILPPGAPDDHGDIRPFASDAAIMLSADLSSEPETRLRRMEVGLGVDPGAVQTGRGHTQVERSFVTLTYREGEDAIDIGKGSIAFRDFSAELNGHLVPLYDAPGTGAFDGFGFRLSAAPMRSVIGQSDDKAAPRVATLTVDGRSHNSDATLEISNFDLETAAGSLRGSASHGYGAEDAITEFRMNGRNLSAVDVKAFWPYNLAVNTRRWVLNHIGDEGRVTEGGIHLSLTKSRMAVASQALHPMTAEELQLDFDVEGVSFTTLGDVPRLIKADGHIATRGSETVVQFTSAGVEEHPSVSITGGSVRFEPAADEKLQEVNGGLTLNLNGNIAELLSIVEKKPLDALRLLNIRPEDAQGTAELTAQLFFLLGDNVAVDKQFIGYDVSTKVAGAGLRTPIEGHVLSGLSGVVHVVPGAISAEVAGKIDGLPASITVARPFGDNPAVERKLEITSTLDADALAGQSPGLSDVVDGQIGVKLIEGQGGHMRAEIDLANAALHLPVIGWRKGRGVATRVTLDIAREDGDTLVRNIVVKGDGFSAKGAVRADKEGVKAADFDNVAFNPDDDVSVHLQRVSNGFSVRIEGPSFDARPFLQDMKDTLGAKAQAPRLPGQRQLDVSVAIDRLTGFGSEKLDRFSADYAGSGTEIAALSISAKTSGGGAFTADLSPRGEARSIRVRAADAGRVFSFAGLYGRMKGGALALDLVGSIKDGYRGTLACDTFTLVDEPRLSSIVGSSRSPNGATLSQALGTDLRTENAAFDHASAGIVYGKGGLRVSDGIIRGPVFGSSFSGTVYDPRNRIDIVGSFMPAYGLNGIFRNVPLVGQILGNGNEGGIIGITYKLDGPFASPKLTVNPISAIAPGIFRSIFAYQ